MAFISKISRGDDDEPVVVLSPWTNGTWKKTSSCWPGNIRFEAQGFQQRRLYRGQMLYLNLRRVLQVFHHAFISRKQLIKTFPNFKLPIFICSRYRAEMRRENLGFKKKIAVVPEPPSRYNRAASLPTLQVSPDRIMMCRKVYDYRQKRCLKNPVWQVLERKAVLVMFLRLVCDIPSLHWFHLCGMWL